MAKHTVYDYELAPMLEALDKLFSPQNDGKSEARGNYQYLHHMLVMLRERTW